MNGFAIIYDLKAECVDAFLDACVANGRASLAHDGALRFDVLHDKSRPTRVVLIECYANEADKAAHLASAHFHAWRDATRDLHASPPVFIGGTFLIGRGLPEA
jgi:autoinducer 2-degrading protein